MKPVRRAVIDVGTNSIKVLVADVTGREVVPVFEDSNQTRLGQGFYEKHELQAEAIAATASGVAKFAQMAGEYQAVSIRVIATSAAREAANRQELVTAVEAASGLKLQIISGEQEADWAFEGVTTDPAFSAQPLLLLDVGGGSTELILGQGQHKRLRCSFPLGAVRLMERIPPSDPPKPQELVACQNWLHNFLQTEVRPQVEAALTQDRRLIQLVGTGGSATIMARMEGQLRSYDRQRIELTRLSLERLQWHLRHLWTLPLEQRKNIVGLPPSRADIILAGAAIYEAILREFNFPDLRITTRGLRFAAVMESP